MLKYNAPIDGSKSTMDAQSNSDQMHNFVWLRKALIEEVPKQVFTQLGSTQDLPKHYGKAVRKYVYIPLLDDRNINDEGIDANGLKIENGNLYGSSRDVGKIVASFPVLSEKGGRVNRVGFTRKQIEGSIIDMGFFFEFTRDSLDFDSDDGLKEHLSRMLMEGAVQINEDCLQNDLLKGAGVVMYSGAATKDTEVTGEKVAAGAGTPEIPESKVTYRTMMRLDSILTRNRTPKHTKIVKGTSLTDTVTLPSCRVMYVGPEVTPLLREMRDLFGERAFIPAHKYAAGTQLLHGEIGSVDTFRIIEVEHMQHWAGKGAIATEANPGYHTTVNDLSEERYDIFPMLVVGSESFSVLRFMQKRTAGMFEVLTVMPQSNASTFEPFAKTGFSSIQWWYGMLLERQERIGVIKTVAPI